MRRTLDNYPTPSRLTEVLVRHIPIRGRVLEPCAGAGQIAAVLGDSWGIDYVFTNDIDPAFNCTWHEDAADPNATIWRPYKRKRLDWVVTNPPYKLAMPILNNAFQVARVGVAFLLRLSFLEPTKDRAAWLSDHARNMSDMLIFGGPRPSFTDDGRTDSATVAWMVWQRDWAGETAVRFITDWAG